MSIVKQETMYRDALQRSIAASNAKLSSICGKAFVRGGGEYSRAFSQILRIFCGHNDQLIRQINDLVEKHGDKKFSAYNYFDLDTLYAYNKFLEIIISKVKEDYRWGITAKNFNDVLKFAEEYLNRYAGKSGTNYYNKNNPVKIMYRVNSSSGHREVYPRRTISEVEFVRKYMKNSLTAMTDDVYDYFSEKRQETKREIRESIIKAIEDESEYIFYSYNGEKLRLVVEDKQYYVNEQGSGVVDIQASSKDGTLFTTRTEGGRVYRGALYDEYGRLIRESSGEIFYPNEKTSDIISHIKGETPIPTCTQQYDYNDEDQMTFFTMNDE